MAAAAEVAIPDQKRKDAQDRADLIRTGLRSYLAAVSDTMALIQDAKENEDWEALGYPNYLAYIVDEFGEVLATFPEKERRQWIAPLRAAKLSTREIAAAVGVSQPTVSRELRRESGASPQDSKPAGTIDGEVISDTTESKGLADIRAMIQNMQTSVGYLATQGTLPEDLTAQQATEWRELICGKRGKGHAGLVKQLREFADRLT